MMIIQDEQHSPILKAESSLMIGSNDDLVMQENEADDLSVSATATTTSVTSTGNELMFKSPNRRKQIKPNRVTNDDGSTSVQQRETPFSSDNTDAMPTDLTNGQNSQSSSSSSPTEHHQNRPQEAYCNLCERSFCNKYFLKTHFAKKHGVLNLASPSSSSSQSLLPAIEHTSNHHHLPLLKHSSGSCSSSSLSTSPALPNIINNNNNNNNNGSEEQPLPLLVAQPSVKSVEKSKVTSDTISEDYCEICQKRFCNKYYLRKHKGECHGIYTDYIKSLQKSANESPVKHATSRPSPPTQENLILVPSNTSNMLLLNPFTPQQSPFYLRPTDVKSLYPNSETSSSSSSTSFNLFPKVTPSTNDQSIPATLKSSPNRPVRRCDVCQQEFRNKALLRMHMNTFHPTSSSKKTSVNGQLPKSSNPTPNFPISPSANLGFLQPYVDTASPLAHKLVAGQAPQASYGILHDSYFCAKMADRVVCEICNKQVCNKYFLKTHKAKVHGITNGTTTNNSNGTTMIPLPGNLVLSQSNKTNDEESSNLNNRDENEIDNHQCEPNDLDNADTYCSLCKKDFSTKYLYLLHMQTMHPDSKMTPALSPETTYQTLIQFMKAAAAISDNPAQNPFLSLTALAAAVNGGNNEQFSLTNNRAKQQQQQQQQESEDEADGNEYHSLKRKRSMSNSSAEENEINHSNKRTSPKVEANGGLQPFLLESEDPKFIHTFVPCMVYLPVTRRVTKQVKINLRLKPVLADAST